MEPNAHKPEKHKVKVIVRVRPQLEKDDKTWVQVTDKTTLLTLNHRNSSETLQYDFESVFGPTSSQAEVYNDCVKPLLNKTLHGQNASVFAYGPTGAGKTHTILGTATDPGVIPRCVKGIFSSVKEEMNKCKEHLKFDVQFSYLEIYQEKVHDLLQPRPVDLPIREDQQRNIFVTGLSEKAISSVKQFNEYFAPASRNRTTAATKLNERSSRSHSILLLKVTRTQTCPPFKKQVGKMYVIDLAGSEDNRRTGNQGVRLKESGAINSSLLALGQVVDALQRGQTCVPYRSSRLTRLLQDSLGGTAHTCMIVNLAPEERFYFDTYTTLHFARKTKKVVNIIKTNVSFAQVTKVSGTKRSLDQKDVQHQHTPKKPKQEPTQFLSPLLRDQQQFRSQLKEEMFTRLEELESRLMNQMKSGQSESTASANVVVKADADSTGDEEHLSSEGGAQTMDRMEDILNQLKQLKDDEHHKEKEKKSRRKSRTQPTRKSKVFSDGSKLVDTKDHVSSSPLFAKTSIIKRKGFTSTAARKFIDSPLSSAKASKDKENNSSNSSMNPDLQKAHNSRILMTLNTGNLKELQELQTVGNKRAKLIQSWRDLNGHFAEFDDLRHVTGLTSKYVGNFLRNNLVHVD